MNVYIVTCNRKMHSFVPAMEQMFKCRIKAETEQGALVIAEKKIKEKVGLSGFTYQAEIVNA